LTGRRFDTTALLCDRDGSPSFTLSKQLRQK
jgi:hypothetical protein